MATPVIANAGETDLLVDLFVPQAERERLQARPQRDELHVLEDLVFLIALLEIVVGDARTQVMNVMVADATGNPLQEPR